jgi:hypothetical protein
MSKTRYMYSSNKHANTGSSLSGGLLVFFIFILACKSQKLERQVLEIEQRILYPVLVPTNNGMQPLTDTLLVQYRRDTVLYVLSYTKLNTLFDSVISESKKPEYFIFRSGKQDGIFITSKDTAYKLNKANVDSMLSKRAFKNDISTDGLVFSERIYGDEKNAFKDVYTVNSNNENEVDTVCLSFDKTISHIPHSLSRKQDSTQNAKLYRIQAIINKQSNSSTGEILPRREYVLEFEIRKKAAEKIFDSVITIIQKRQMNF